MMDAIFSNMIDDNLVIIYMDDILIFALDELILAENTKKVFVTIFLILFCLPMSFHYF